MKNRPTYLCPGNSEKHISPLVNLMIQHFRHRNQRSFEGVYTCIIRKDYVADAMSHLTLERPRGPEIRDGFCVNQVRVVATKITITAIKKACLMIHVKDKE